MTGRPEIVAGLTLVAQQRLPHKKMLVLTGVLLGGVLLVMMGEQAQEMQLAHWLPTTPLRWLADVIPAWVGLWFAVFPTVETLAAQLAALLVLGSYRVVQGHIRRPNRAAVQPPVEKRVRARRMRSRRPARGPRVRSR